MRKCRLVAANGWGLDKNSAQILAGHPDSSNAHIEIMYKDADVTMALTGGRRVKSWMVPAVIPVLTYEQAREMIMALVLRKRSRLYCHQFIDGYGILPRQFHRHNCY